MQIQVEQKDNTVERKFIAVDIDRFKDLGSDPSNTKFIKKFQKLGYEGKRISNLYLQKSNISAHSLKYLID